MLRSVYQAMYIQYTKKETFEWLYQQPYENFNLKIQIFKPKNNSVLFGELQLWI